MKERAQDVLRHRDAMRAARAGERDLGGQVGQGEPALDPGRERLDPAKPRRARQHTRRGAPGQHGLAPREQIRRRLFADPAGVQVHAIGKPRAGEGIAIRARLVQPEQYGGLRRRHDRSCAARNCFTCFSASS